MSARAAKQIGALPWRKRKGQIEVLLVTSRDTRRWVIPKGWPMDDLQDYNAARREAWEEAGVEGHVKRKPIGFYHYDKRLKDGSLQSCRVAVFALEVEKKNANWREKNERERKWFVADEAIWHVDETELKDIIKQFSHA